jgi:hypothetical protein
VWSGSTRLLIFFGSWSGTRNFECGTGLLTLTNIIKNNKFTNFYYR